MQISISQFYPNNLFKDHAHFLEKLQKKTPVSFFLFFFFFNSLIFGAITCFTGFLGVITGAGATKWCRLKTQRADPLVCAVGMLGSAIFICLIFVAAKSSIVGAYVSIILCIRQSHSYCLYQTPWKIVRCWSCFSSSECPSFCPLGILALSRCAWRENDISAAY